MKLTEEQTRFLEGVDAYNTQFNAVCYNGSTEPLYHCFWKMSDIEQAKEILSEWDIADYLMPFYGDWHDVICLDIRTNSILLLDDNRHIVHQWESLDTFVSALTSIGEEPIDDLGIIEDKSWLDI